MLRLGIIGPGKIAHRFANACKDVKDVKVIAVASSNKERGQDFAKEFGIEKVYDYDSILDDPDVNAVYISVVNSMHYPVAKHCLEAGKAVICEKPMCLDYAQTKDLVETAKKYKVLLMECLWTSFIPCMKKAKAWIKEGKIGQLKYMESSFAFFAPKMPEARLFNKELGGGGALDVGIYCILFALLVEEKMPKTCLSSINIGDTQVDEMGAALLQFEDGVVANCTFGVQGMADNKATIYGSEGQIQLTRFCATREVRLCDPWGKVIEVFEDPAEDGFVYQIQAFRDAYADGLLEVPGAGHQLSLDCAELIEKIKGYR